ncbi:hypothetical protein TIFTF001_048932 [Ficus carica]|uniref:Uncharacterized protein n=1 Tax=Ficus carica TaxID=3494 RepID=A0AA87YRT9_FICCA|nr:hypothetical protein TIFTF001_048930 [Ficus carica]GMN21819.1 hypothetical protein TIFTF001_048932 [Ficus carica]
MIPVSIGVVQDWPRFWTVPESMPGFAFGGLGKKTIVDWLDSFLVGHFFYKLSYGRYPYQPVFLSVSGFQHRIVVGRLCILEQQQNVSKQVIQDAENFLYINGKFFDTFFQFRCSREY